MKDSIVALTKLITILEICCTDISFWISKAQSVIEKEDADEAEKMIRECPFLFFDVEEDVKNTKDVK